MGKPASDKQLIHMLMDEPLLKRLDNFRIKYRLDSRSEAARWLMKAALDKDLAPKPAAKKER
jgi:metal-responsive CopG/Arc/MetJ family transcriptional regulator